MLELIDNLSQFLVTLIVGSVAGCLYCHSRKQAYFLLTCFYGCFAAAGLYWTLYYLLFSETPQIFYVSEIGWISGYIFLYLLQYVLSDKNERTFRCHAMWLSPVVGGVLLVLYCFYGHILSNIVFNGMMILISWNAIRGLVYLRGKEEARDLRCLHLVILCFCVAEYGLWTTSCFWVSNTITNPYFWFDFLLTAIMVLLLLVTRKAVSS